LFDFTDFLFDDFTDWFDFKDYYDLPTY